MRSSPEARPERPGGSRRVLFEGRGPLLVGLGLVLLTLITFLPALDCDFVNYDDPDYVTANAWVRGGLTSEGVSWALGAVVSSNYHPVTVLSHMLDVELFGLNPRGHHLSSLLIHLANVFLVFIVLRRLTGGLWASALVAALFAVHPLRVETVAWISDRKDLLSAFFWLLALSAYLTYTRRPSFGRYLVLMLLAALSLFSKATAVVLPCTLLLLDLWPLGRVPRDSWLAAARSLPRLVLEKLPLFALSIVAGLLTVSSQHQALVAVETVPFAHRLANAAVAYLAYISKTIAPHDLAVFYPQVPIPLLKATLAAGFLALVSAAALAAWRRMPYLTVGWFWFLGALVPMIGLAQVGNQAMADRYSYFSGLGLLLAVVHGFAAWTKRDANVWPRRLLATVAIAVVLVLPFQSRAQLRHWRDSVTLFQQAVNVTTPNVVAHLNLAEGLRAAGRMDEAERHYRAVLVLAPNQAEAYAGLGALALGRNQPEAGIEWLEKAVSLKPENANLHHALAAGLNKAQRYDEAIVHLEKAIELQPDRARAHLGLADLYTKTGQPQRARQHIEKAMALGSRAANSRATNSGAPESGAPESGGR